MEAEKRPYSYEQPKSFEDWRQEPEPDRAGTFVRVCSLFNKILKILLNIVVLVLYRRGDGGYFMGTTYNKNKDAEALTSGIFVGYMIYNIASIIADVITPRIAQIQDTRAPLMNFIGTILWMTVGGVAIQFWSRFQPENHFTETNPMAAGISMGGLAIISSLLYLIDTLITCATYFCAEY